MRFVSFLSIIVFCSFGANSLAQLAEPINEKKNTLITFHTSGFSSTNTHEVRLERFVHPRWSLIYATAYSNQNLSSNFSEIRLPLGCSLGVGIGALAVSTCYAGGTGFFELALLSAMIPDGVAYHLYMGKDFSVSPYVNVSGLMLKMNNETGTSFYYSPSAGVRLMYYIGEHFVLSGEQTFRRTQSGHIENYIGASVSLRL